MAIAEQPWLAPKKSAAEIIDELRTQVHELQHRVAKCTCQSHPRDRTLAPLDEPEQVSLSAALGPLDEL